MIDNACTDDTAELAAAHGVRRIALHPAAQLRGGAQRGDRRRPTARRCCCSTPTASCAPASWPPRCPGWPRTGVGSVAPSCFARRDTRGRPRRARPDRRRRDGRRPPPQERARRPRSQTPAAYAAAAPAFGADGAAALYRRETLAACRLGEPRCLTRTWSCGPRTPTWPGAPSCWAGAACTSRRRWPSTCAPTARAPARRSASATGGCSSATAT